MELHLPSVSNAALQVLDQFAQEKNLDRSEAFNTIMGHFSAHQKLGLPTPTHFTKDVSQLSTQNETGRKERVTLVNRLLETCVPAFVKGSIEWCLETFLSRRPALWNTLTTTLQDKEAIKDQILSEVTRGANLVDILEVLDDANGSLNSTGLQRLRMVVGEVLPPASRVVDGRKDVEKLGGVHAPMNDVIIQEGGLNRKTGAWISPRALLQFLFSLAPESSAPVPSSSTSSFTSAPSALPSSPDSSSSSSSSLSLSNSPSLPPCRYCQQTWKATKVFNGQFSHVVASFDGNKILSRGSTLGAVRTFPCCSSHKKLQSPMDCYAILRTWGGDCKANMRQWLGPFQELQEIQKDPQNPINVFKVTDMKGQQLAHDCGGAAGKGKETLFCTCCECKNSTRGQLLVWEEGEWRLTKRDEVIKAIAESGFDPRVVRQFRPRRFPIGRKKGDNPLPGFCFCNSSPCILHCECRIACQCVNYFVREMMNSNRDLNARNEKLDRLNDFLQRYIFGTPENPGAYRVVIGADGKPSKVSLKNTQARRFFLFHEKFLTLFENEKERKMMALFFQALNGVTEIWNRGRRCTKADDPDHECKKVSETREVPITWNPRPVELNKGFLDPPPPPNFSLPIPPSPFETLLADETLEAAAAQEGEASVDDDDDDLACTFTMDRNDEEWDELQSYADVMVVCWICVYGEGSVYNYLHWLGASHFYFYGRAFRNLAMMSQQALEHIQGSHSSFAAHSTQRGGSVGKNKLKTDPMVDLLRRVQRKVGYRLLKARDKLPTLYTTPFWRKPQGKMTLLFPKPKRIRKKKNQQPPS